VWSVGGGGSVGGRDCRSESDHRAPSGQLKVLPSAVDAVIWTRRFRSSRPRWLLKSRCWGRPPHALATRPLNTRVGRQYFQGVGVRRVRHQNRTASRLVDTFRNTSRQVHLGQNSGQKADEACGSAMVGGSRRRKGPRYVALEWTDLPAASERADPCANRGRCDHANG